MSVLRGVDCEYKQNFCVDYAEDLQEDDPQDICMKGAINGFGFRYRTSVARCIGLINSELSDFVASTYSLPVHVTV